MNGVIGFVPGSQSVTVDEDGPRRSAILKVQRTKATFGEVQVCSSRSKYLHLIQYAGSLF